MIPMLKQVRVLEAQGFEPVVAVFRDRAGKNRCLTILENGAQVTTFLEWLAACGPDDEGIEATTEPSTDDASADGAIHAIVEQMLAQGYDATLMVFLNEREQARILAHEDVVDLPAFLRELAADVDPADFADMAN